MIRRRVWRTPVGKVFRLGLKLAFCENYILRWASCAPAHHEFFCPRCGVEVFLDHKVERFNHPESGFCSEALANQKTALLYMFSVLHELRPCLQALARCRICCKRAVCDLIVKTGTEVELLPLAGSNMEGILVHASHPYYVVMRPFPGQDWFPDPQTEWMAFDPRNVLSPGLLQPTDGGGTPLSCTDCIKDKGDDRGL